MYKPLKFDAKDPNDQLDYALDFTLDLNTTLFESIVGDPVITTSTTTGIASQLVLSNIIVLGNVVSVFITGGVANTTCLVTYEITTSLNNVISRSVILPIQQR